MSNKVSFAGLMKSDNFANFNNVKMPERDPYEAVPSKELAEAMNKIIRELLRRSEHGIEESPFTETDGDLLKLLYPMSVVLEMRMSKS